MPQLRVLTLDQCKIRKIENLTACKKLTHLSLRGNLIEDCSIQGGAQQLIELKNLCLSRNRITQIRTIYGYPNLEELEIDNNPLFRIHPQATMNIKHLKSLDLSHCKFQNVH
jgi:Leucine-rich repeat (LRR) protein